MDGPDVDWKVEGYSSSDYIIEERKSNVKWILEKGLGVGKKVVIAGFVVSSVPLVLPSVIVISALGIAFSVPFGLLFAGYTCTQKLMNKLLPLPTEYPMLEYDILFGDEDEKDGVENIDMEEEQMVDITQGIEQRIQLVKAENELPQEDDDDLKEIREDDEERLARGDENSKEDGYEEDDDESLEEKDRRSGEVIETESKDEEPLREVKRIVVVVGGEKSADNFGMSEDLVLVVRRVGGVVQDNQTAIDHEGKDLKKETVSLIEKIKDEGNAGDAASEKSHFKGDNDVTNVGMMQELENPMEIENEHLETGNLGSVAKEVEPAVKMEDVLLEKKGVGNRNNVVARELTVDYSTLINGKHAAENGHRILAEKQAPAQSSEVRIQHEAAQRDDDSNLYEAMHPNGVTREAAYVKDSTDQTSSESYKNYQGNRAATDPIVNENVDLIEVQVTARSPEPEHNDYTSQMDSVVPSEKVPITGDKKIWDQIDALRTIVGYKATPQKSCFDEVKALYIFTGVEPPSSFENTTDLAELNDKLRFLMSIVGVK